MQHYQVALAFSILFALMTCLGIYKMMGSTDEFAKESTFLQTCSGNGKIYPDHPNKCDCFNCFQGDYCEKEIPDCEIYDIGGNPELHQQYWEKHETIIQSSTVYLQPDYRTGYEHFSHLIYENDDENVYHNVNEIRVLGSTFTPALNKVIRSLHRQVGNAQVDGYTIVLGTGGAGLISAAIWALTEIHKQKTNRNNDVMRVFARTPFFGAYRNWANMYPSTTQWNASYEQWDAIDRIIEFVTTPNNPDGKVRWDPHYKSSNYVVHDMVYYWPYLTDTSYKADKDIMIFSLSKLTGHAGTRFGWALVKDKKVAQLMSNFIVRVEAHTSIDSQYRALRILQHLTDGNGPSFFSYLKEKLAQRWHRVMTIFAKGPMANRFTIESTPYQFYLWIKCLRAEENCYKFMEANGIMGWPGDDFGGLPGRYVRLELVLRDSAFEILLRRFERIANSEKEYHV